jgi:hypothetical protein
MQSSQHTTSLQHPVLSSTVATFQQGQRPRTFRCQVLCSKCVRPPQFKTPSCHSALVARRTPARLHQMQDLRIVHWSSVWRMQPIIGIAKFYRHIKQNTTRNNQPLAAVNQYWEQVTLQEVLPPNTTELPPCRHANMPQSWHTTQLTRQAPRLHS